MTSMYTNNTSLPKVGSSITKSGYSINMKLIWGT